MNKLNLTIFLIFFLTGLSCEAQTSTQGEKHNVLFATHKGDKIPYRIPALAVNQSGEILAVTDYRFCGNDIGFGRVDFHSRVSSDEGKTWGKENIIISGTGVKKALDCGYGDAALVADRESNEVLLMCVCGEEIYWKPETTRENPMPIARLRSHDGGKTWSKATVVTEQIYSLFDGSKLGNVAALFFGSGRISQSRVIKVGKYYRLYAALCARPGGNRVIYSDDFGETWHALGDIHQSPAPKGDEPKCEELPDGRVLLSSRVKGGRYFNIYSYDNIADATGKWDTVAFSGAEVNGTVAVDNSTNGEILIVPAQRVSDGKKVNIALQSVPLGPNRANVGIYYKALLDGTYKDPSTFSQDWEGKIQISALPSAYSTMIQQTDGTIGVFYEEETFEAGYSMVYDNYSLETLTQGKYTAIKK